MNAAAVTTTVQRLAARQRHLLRRCCWTTGIGSGRSGSAALAPVATTIANYHSRSRSVLPIAPTRRSPPLVWTTTTTTTAARSFATSSGGNGGDGNDEDGDKKGGETSDSVADVKDGKEVGEEEEEPSVAASFLLGDDDDRDGAEPPTPLVIDLDSHTNAETDAYDPFAITDSFGDTSYYYYPPSHEKNDPSVLKARYEGMTNEELLDGSTIGAAGTDDPETGTTTTTRHTWNSLIHSPPVRDKNRGLPRGTLVGMVVSTKMQKTINVAVDRFRIHKKYRKRIRYTRKFMAHDESEVARDGDLVTIVPSQRISKKKHFVLREILRAKGQL